MVVGDYDRVSWSETCPIVNYLRIVYRFRGVNYRPMWPTVWSIKTTKTRKKKSLVNASYVWSVGPAANGRIRVKEPVRLVAPVPPQRPLCVRDASVKMPTRIHWPSKEGTMTTTTTTTTNTTIIQLFRHHHHHLIRPDWSDCEPDSVERLHHLRPFTKMTLW